jgi:SAM-dependent methyltransferase
MSDQPFYREYVTDEKFLTDYQRYQQRYAVTIRESDRILIELLRGLVTSRPEGDAFKVVDVGCSTGNLLLHIKNALPALSLTGGELDKGSLELCRTNPDLSGIRFEEIDLLKIPYASEFDAVLVNAVLYMLAEAEFKQALHSVAAALRPGGTLLAFDFFHPYDQQLDIKETSETHPNGLMLHFRPQHLVRQWLADAGFDSVKIHPFRIPVDLPHPERAGDMRSYSVLTSTAERLLFRGALFQPWCHLVAVKGA